MTCLGKGLPVSKRQILYSSELKEFADDNFKFDEIGRKFSKRVENTVGKGEIARYKQFLLFPQCFFFLKLILQTSKNKDLFGKGLNLHQVKMSKRYVKTDYFWEKCIKLRKR